jgi:hypothetical protein
MRGKKNNLKYQKNSVCVFGEQTKHLSIVGKQDI